MAVDNQLTNMLRRGPELCTVRHPTQLGLECELDDESNGYFLFPKVVRRRLQRNA